MFAARRFATTLPRTLPQRALFHNTAPALVQKGDSLPDLDVLVENSPGNKVNLAREIKNKGIIIGTPAAFSTCPSQHSLSIIGKANHVHIGPACSSSHVPGYINHPKLKDAGQVFVVSVNDPFVYVVLVFLFLDSELTG